MQTQTVPLTISADVAKDEIVVTCEEQHFAPHGIANRRPTLAAFLKTLPAGSCIGMESTGTYHELFATLAHKMGFVVYVLNPKDPRHYAKAVGQRGKTDRVDAKLIARFVEREHAKLHAWIPPTPEQRQLNRLIKRRAKLSSIKAALTQSLKDLAGFSAELKALRERVQHVIECIDAARHRRNATAENEADAAYLRH